MNRSDNAPHHSLIGLSIALLVAAAGVVGLFRALSTPGADLITSSPALGGYIFTILALLLTFVFGSLPFKKGEGGEEVLPKYCYFAQGLMRLLQWSLIGLLAVVGSIAFGRQLLVHGWAETLGIDYLVAQHMHSSDLVVQALVGGGFATAFASAPLLIVCLPLIAYHAILQLGGYPGAREDSASLQDNGQL